MSSDSILCYRLAFLSVLCVRAYDIPTRCYLQVPEGCSCTYPARPQITCQPVVKLTQAPVFYTPGVHTLDLSGNSIQTVNMDFCRSCVGVKRLRFDNNLISEFFTTLNNQNTWYESVEYLDLSQNQLDSMVFLKFFSSIVTVKLNNNLIQTVNSFDLDGLFYLRELYLHDNPVSFLDAEAGHLKSMSLTVIQGGQIIKIPNLETLQIVNSSIESQLSKLPMSSLRSLEIAQCSLTMKNLQSIDWAKSENLRLLSLRNNLINFGHTYLLNRRQHSSFNKILRHNSDLEFLDLSGNFIGALPGNAFRLLSKLKTLNLQNCNISQVSWKFLKQKPQLEVLDLSRNRISSYDGLRRQLYRIETFQYIKLAGNIFTCRCETQDLFDMANEQLQGERHVLDPVELHHSLKCPSGSLIAYPAQIYRCRNDGSTSSYDDDDDDGGDFDTVFL